MAARLFTHGYTIYSPNVTAVEHFYTTTEDIDRLKIPKYWDYHWGRRFPIMFRATHRLRHKLGLREWMAMDPDVDDCELGELERYGLGRRRTVEQFLEWAKIDLLKKTAEGVCKEMRRNTLRRVPWNEREDDPVAHPPAGTRAPRPAWNMPAADTHG